MVAIETSGSFGRIANQMLEKLNPKDLSREQLSELIQKFGKDGIEKGSESERKKLCRGMRQSKSQGTGSKLLPKN